MDHSHFRPSENIEDKRDDSLNALMAYFLSAANPPTWEQFKTMLQHPMTPYRDLFKLPDPGPSPLGVQAGYNDIVKQPPPASPQDGQNEASQTPLPQQFFASMESQEVTPRERDLITRTVLSEAGPKASSLERAAITHVIMNRINAGKDGGFGEGAMGVLMQPHAFEPWNIPASAPNHPMRFDPSSAPYKAAAETVDAVLGGKTPDPTNGATHFLQPETVQQRVRQGALAEWPKWAAGDGMRIGAHSFYSPAGKGKAPAASEADSYFKKYLSPSDQKPEARDPDRYFEKYLDESTQPPAKTASAPAPAPSEAPPGAVPTAPQVGTGKTFETAEEHAAALARGQENGSLEGKLKSIHDAIDPTKVIPAAAGAAWENLKKGAATAGGGILDMLKGGDVLPTIKPTMKPVSYDPTGPAVHGFEVEKPGGLLTTLGGAAEATSVPALTNLIEQGAAKVTGNEVFGKKVGALAGMALLPGGRAAASPAVRGVNSAAKDIIRDVGEKNLPELIKRLETGTTALVDESPNVMRSAQGIATQAGPDLQNHLFNFATERTGGAKAAAQAALDAAGHAPSATAALEKLRTDVQKVGKEKIEPVVNAIKSADVTSVISHIDKEIAGGSPVGGAIVRDLKADNETNRPMTDYQNRLWQIRQKIVGKANPDRETFLTDVKGENGLHWTQSELRRDAQDLLQSSVGSERAMGAKLMGLREKIVDRIDAASPDGAYRKSLSQYRDANQVNEAYQRGYDFSKTTPGLKGQLAHEEWPVWSKTASKEEMEAARWGALTKIRQDLGQMRTAGLSRTVTSIPDVAYTASHLETLFGKKVAADLSRKLKDEQNKAITNQRLLGNSETAFRQEAAKRWSPPSERKAAGLSVPIAAGGYAGLGADALISGVTGIPFSGVAAGVAAGKVASKIAAHTADAQHGSRMNAYVRLATATTGPEREELLQLLRAHARKQVGSSEKLRNLISAPVTRALPR